MKQICYARKINQFRNTARQVNELLESRRWQTLAESSKHQFQWKLNNLFEMVRNFLSKKELKKILATAAFLICLGNVNAQTFSPAVNNPYGLTNPGDYVLPSFADMDCDGDLDIIAVSYNTSLIFYENTGTAILPSFAAPQTFAFGLYPIIFRPVPADIDDDGDLDIFSGEYYGAYKYFENTGTAANPSFAPPVTNPFGLDSADEIGFPVFADLDNDGDMDLLSNEYYGNFKYYENTGTASSPNFAAPLTNPFGFSISSPYEAYPAVCDLDIDGDLDVLTGSWGYGGNMYYYENSGSVSVPDFTGTPLLNPFGITEAAVISVPTFGDIDNDGDMDLIVGDTTGNFIYFENTTISSVGNIGSNSISFSVSPNPASEYTIINAGTIIKNITVKISDISGKLIYKAAIENNETTVNTTGFSKGVYIVELSDGNYIFRKKLIIE